jgi:lipopolysaccharide exporter
MTETSSRQVLDTGKPSDEDLPSLSAKVRRGAVWSAFSTLLLRLVNVAITAVVAHILSPHDFGVFTVALTVFTIVSSLSELGIASCLIRADLDIDAIAPTMLMISLEVCAIFALAMAVFAQKIATALGSAEGAQSIRVLALAVLISGYFTIAGAQLTRNFAQDKLFWANVISLIPSTIVLLVLAKSGGGALAFAWSRVVASLVMGCIMVASAPRRYWPGFSRSALSVLLKFGMPLAGANFVNFVLLNVDYAFVGHLMGPVPLGTYVLAFNLASAPGLLLGSVINSVAMPAFSRVKHDPDLLRSGTTSALRIVSLILMPMCALMFVLSRPIVLTFYGARWSGSAEVLSILSIYGAVSIICVLFANILTSLGKARFSLVVQLLWLGFLIPAMAIGVHRNGIVGAAEAHIVVIAPLILPCYLFALRRATGIHLVLLAKTVLPAAVAAAIAAVAASAVAPRFTSSVAQLAAGAAVGSFVYAVAAAPQIIRLVGRERIAKLPLLRRYSAAVRGTRLGAVRRASAVPGPPQPTFRFAGQWDGEHKTMPIPIITVAPDADLSPAGYHGLAPVPPVNAKPIISDPGGEETMVHLLDRPGPTVRSRPPSVGGSNTSGGGSTRTIRRPPAPGLSKRERSVRRRVGLAWCLLVLNALTYYGSVLHVPSALGKLVTQGALPLALVVALSVNRKLAIRPSIFLSLVSLLAIEALFTTLQPQHFGSIYRTFRLAEFVVALWLLTPWWGRRDLLLVRCHLIALSVALGSVFLGLLLYPGAALSGGRLNGVLWFIPATEVGHYAAVTMGLVIVLWLGGRLRGKLTLGIVAAEGVVLLLTHTRTALIAMIGALIVAGLSLSVTRARVRKFFASAGIIALIGAVIASGAITAWLARGQSTEELTSLTGRTQFWGLVLNLPRTRFQEIVGSGLSNGSIDGLPIDSNWLVAYMLQGIIGVVISAAMALFVFVAAFFQPPRTERALALFLVTYCLIASFTQVGFATVTTYLLELTLAASLLVPSATGTVVEQ